MNGSAAWTLVTVSAEAKSTTDRGDISIFYWKFVNRDGGCYVARIGTARTTDAEQGSALLVVLIISCANASNELSLVGGYVASVDVD